MSNFVHALHPKKRPCYKRISRKILYWYEGLYIYSHPTPERAKYLVLSLNFAEVNADPECNKLEKNTMELYINI